MNINGKNGLACLTNMRTLPGTIVLKPLPGLPVIRDLIVDMTQFFKQYNSIKPYLVNDERAAREGAPAVPEERDELNGLYECILCASCSTSCPSFWWNPDKFVGPAGLLQAYRFIADSRDQDTAERLDNLEDPYRLFRCHTIMNCVDVCPKGLNPTKAIGKIKELMVRRRHLKPPCTGAQGGVERQLGEARTQQAAVALPPRPAGERPVHRALLPPPRGDDHDKAGRRGFRP
jgi:succinate dehydrogenase / fumarate reductase iron-sulfur subunit